MYTLSYEWFIVHIPVIDASWVALKCYHRGHSDVTLCCCRSIQAPHRWLSEAGGAFGPTGPRERRPGIKQQSITLSEMGVVWTSFLPAPSQTPKRNTHTYTKSYINTPSHLLNNYTCRRTHITHLEACAHREAQRATMRCSYTLWLMFALKARCEGQLVDHCQVARCSPQEGIG